MVLKPCLGARWIRFWRSLGHPLVSLGRPWVAFGEFLAPLGQPWAASWDVLGCSWASLGWSRPLLKWILGSRNPRGFDFRGSGDVLGRVWRVAGSHFTMVFAAHCALLPQAFFGCSSNYFCIHSGCFSLFSVRRSVRSTWNQFKNACKKYMVFGIVLFVIFLDFGLRNQLFFNEFLMHASIQISLIFGTLSPSQSISFGCMFDTF